MNPIEKQQKTLQEMMQLPIGSSKRKEKLQQLSNCIKNSGKYLYREILGIGKSIEKMNIEYDF